VGEWKARAWFGATALAVFVGLSVQLFVTAGVHGGFFGSTADRVLNLFCFFTVQSNLIVGISCLLLAMNPVRPSTAFRAFRVAGVLGITVTGLVYHAVLGKLFDLESWALVADNLLHTVVPVMAVVG
jgi:hypothetical protein